MPGPLKSQVHIDTLLTDLSIGFVQDQEMFIADKVSPIIKVAKSSDKYPIWDAADFLRLQTDETDRNSPAPEATFEMSSSTYSCEEWPLKKLILDKDRTDADVDLDDATVRFLTQQQLLRRELQVITKLFTSGNWTTTATGAASGSDFVHFSDSSSTPYVVVRAYLRTLQKLCGGFKPNTIVACAEVADYLLEHDDTLDKIKHTSDGGFADYSDLAKGFGVANFLVTETVYNVHLLVV